MSERKVLNKYYPPDFDPSKIPRMKLSRNRQYTVRLMAPFNMRCVTCGEYIYKGKKFNARKEDVENQDYLGIRIYRFYIKCTRCLQEISFKTDPKNTDYEIEAGATRNFMALKLAEEQAKREEDELKEEEANNPMKLLENRTEQSRNEIELLESLEELKDLNRRQATVDYDTMLKQFTGETAEERRKREEREDEDFIKSIKFSRGSTSQNKRIISEEIIEDIDSGEVISTKKIKVETIKDDEESLNDKPSGSEPKTIQNANDTTKTKLITNSSTNVLKPIMSKERSWNKSVGIMSRKGGLAGLVKVKSKSEDAVKDAVKETVPPVNKPSNEVVNSSSVKLSEKIVEVTSNPISSSTVSVASGGLSLLAGYSDSDSNNSD